MKARSRHQFAANDERINRTDTSERRDEWEGPAEYRVSPDDLRTLSGVNELRSLLHIIGEWALILSAIYICNRYFTPLLYVLAVMLVGARQHALVILMHDGSHYRLFRKKWVNDVISDALLAWPVFATTRGYRFTHFAHHRFINTEADPDWVRKHTHEWEFPKTWYSLGLILVKDLFGLNSHQLLAEAADVSAAPDARRSATHGYSALRILYYFAIIGLLAYFQLLPLFLLFWVIPLLTWFKVILRIRSIAEHFGIEEHAYALSRTTLPNLFERIFVAPKNVNYHIEHHLYPSVPFYRLPRLHELLMSQPGFHHQAHVTQTYFRVLRECCSRAVTA